MKTNTKEAFIRNMNRFVPGVSVDCVVFGYRDHSLKVLLLKFRDLDVWALPGGFLPIDQEMDEAASNILEERTGVKDIFLRQFHTFGALDRCWECDPTSARALSRLLRMWPAEEGDAIREFLNRRFVSTAYMALVNAEAVNPVPDYASDQCRWIDLDGIPDLVLDHRLIVETALRHLREQMNYLPIGRSLLPDKFTMSEMQFVYEAILGKKLDRGNFQRKILKMGMLIRHEKHMTGARNKAPYLYSIDREVYEGLIREGIGFG